MRVTFSNSHHLLLGMCGSTVILHPCDGDVPAGNLDSTRLSNVLISAEQRSRPKQKYLLSGLDQGLRASSVLIPHQPGMVLSPSELTCSVAGMGRLPRGHPEPHCLQQSFPQLCVQRDVRFRLPLSFPQTALDLSFLSLQKGRSWLPSISNHPLSFFFLNKSPNK